MAKKIALTPASIDALKKGRLAGLLTPGLFVEVLGSGKKRRKYRRQVAGTDIVAVLFGRLYPAQTITHSPEWANGLKREGRGGH